jgi:hypothetical protein
MKIKFCFLAVNLSVLLAALLATSAISSAQPRRTELFTKDWHFHLGDVKNGQSAV